MLNRAHRIVSPLDYRRVVRRGRSCAGQYMVVYVDRGVQGVPRAGFIVSKAVGGATVRNLMKRRLRAATAPLLSSITGDVVVRVLAAATTATYVQLRDELTALVLRAQNERRG